MPIYEYRCDACARKASIFFRTFGHVQENPACPHCGEMRLRRTMSRVWSRRGSGDDNQFGEPSFEHDDVPVYGGGPDDMYGMDDFGGYDDEGSGGEEDVVEMARQAREMASMMGEPLDTEFDMALRHIEQGADPEDVLGELDDTSPPGGPADE